MSLHDFVDKVRVRNAILAAERLTSAPIVVSIAPYFWGNVHHTAERAFRKHRLADAHERNGILFFIVPSRRQFVLLGGAGAHQELGQDTWEKLADALREHFRNDDPTNGLVTSIEEIGRLLARRFPRTA